MTQVITKIIIIQNQIITNEFNSKKLDKNKVLNKLKNIKNKRNKGKYFNKQIKLVNNNKILILKNKYHNNNNNY